jgi:hypothetical protein
MSNEVWNEIYDKLAAFSLQNRTMLVFVNTHLYQFISRQWKQKTFGRGSDRMTRSIDPL